jgi:hypothetical protein
VDPDSLQEVIVNPDPLQKVFWRSGSLALSNFGSGSFLGSYLVDPDSSEKVIVDPDNLQRLL